MIKVNELFSGIGAFRKALENLKIPHEIVGISEIDKYAIKSYEAIYGKTRNYGDISKINKLDYADLWTYGFPCQDISVAGKGAGIVKGETRSGLLYEVEKLLLESQKADELPKYLIMENVKNLVSKKFIADFERWLEFLESLGYINYWQVLNAKDYEIPQNRERVFCISILGEQAFRFPEKQPLKLRLKDLLENEVDEKFYLSQKQVDSIRFSTYCMQKSRIQEKDYCDALSYTDHKRPKCIKIKNGTQRGRVQQQKSHTLTVNGQECVVVKRLGGMFDTEKSKHQAGSIYDSEGISPSIDTSQGDYRQPLTLEKPSICIGSTQKNAAVTDGSYAPTLTSSMGTGGGHVPMIDTEPLKETSVILKAKSEFGRMGKQAIETYNEKQPENNATINPFNKSINTDGLSPTITTRPDGFKTAIDVVDTFRVRKLTPKECWRLMGFDDESFEKAEKVCSNTQLYKQAGNSIVVNVLEKILEILLRDCPWEKESISRSEWVDKLLKE